MKEATRTKRLTITSFLLAVVLASATAINCSNASGTAIINVDSATQQFPSAHLGDTIDVNIDVSSVQNLWSWDIANLKFNPNFLILTQVSEGPFLKAAGSTLFIWTSTSTNAISKGDIPDISDTLLEYTSASGGGVIATLTFRVISLGTSQIIFNRTTLENSASVISSQAVNANITIGASSSYLPISSTPDSASSAVALPAWLIVAISLVATTVAGLLVSRKVRRSRK